MEEKTTEQVVENTEEYVNAKLKNMSAEVATLAYMCKHGVVDTAREEFYSSGIHRALFRVVAKHRTATKSMLLTEANKQVRREKLPLYKATIEKVYNTKTSTMTKKQIAYMLRELAELYESRSILLKTDAVVEAVLRRDLEKAKKLGRDISAVGKSGGRFGGEYLADFEERRDIIEAKISNPDTVGVPTGIQRFDARSGGVLYGEFGIVMGQTSIGKSVALENFALNAWLPSLNIKNRGHNVLYVSLEMGKHDLQFRADARLTRIVSNKFRTGKDFGKADLARWEHKISELRHDAEHFFHIEYVPRGCTVEDVETIAERVQDVYDKELDLIIVDYLNVMGSGADAKGWQFQADIAWGLKGLAADFNGGRGVALWTANQLKDEAQDKKILTFADNKYGRAIVEVAPIVIGLVRTQDDLLNGEMQLQIVKFRNVGKVAPIILRPNLDVALLHDEELFKHKTLENF